MIAAYNKIIEKTDERDNKDCDHTRKKCDEIGAIKGKKNVLSVKEYTEEGEKKKSSEYSC